EQSEDGERRRALRRGLPVWAGDDRQREDGGGEQRDMYDGLPSRRERIDPVRVEIPEKQHDLEEQHARAPHGRRPAEPREDHLGDERLNLEQEGGGEEYGERIKQHRPGLMKDLC